MSQQYQPTGQQVGQTAQPYGTSQQSQQPMGQQQGQGSPGMSQGMGQQQQGSQFQATLPTEFRVALEDFAKVTQVAEWCADLCIEEGPQMAECARACEDLADLAELNEKMIARDSIFGPQVAEAYIQVTQQALPILQQFEGSPHVSETLSAVTRSLDSIEQLLSTIGYQPTAGAGEMGQQPTQGMSQQPTQGMSQQPTQGMSQQPTQGMGQGIGQQPTQGMGQQAPIGQGSFQQGGY